MALTITNNVSSLNAQHNLTRASGSVAKSVERLSSGLKVNRGADGPAALVISEKQRAQIAGLRQAIDNSEKAVSLVQTAEGALNEINSLLVKVRSLALDSANAGVNDSDALAANQSEITNALDTIGRIAENTQFGTKKLLNGDAGITGSTNNASVTFVSGEETTKEGSHTVNVTTVGERGFVTAAGAATTALAQDEVLTVNDTNISLSSGLTQAQVVDRINEFTAETGVVAEISSGGATRLYTTDFGTDATVNVVSNVAPAAGSAGFATTLTSDSGENIQATIGGVAVTGSGNSLTATSGVVDGLTIEVAESATDATLTATGALGSVTVNNNSLVFQIGANQSQTASVAIGAATVTGLGRGLTNNQFNDLSAIDVTSANGAQDAIAVVDAAIDDITNLRGKLGAFQQNTLESTANNLRATLENTVNAESVIRDTDFAEEIANFTKNQVLVQAGTSVLGNANQLPQLVLSLLG